MPNWCSNSLTIEASKKVLKEIMLRYTTEDPENNNLPCIDFNKILPIPEEMRDKPSPSQNPQRDAKFLKKYGAKDWYDWCIKNWGTKWNARGYGFTDNKDELIFDFDTAWGPPTEAIALLAKACPDAKIRLEYCEPGMVFAGWEEYYNGEKMDDYYTEDNEDQLFINFGFEPFEPEDNEE